jgi:hypothetical protein
MVSAWWADTKDGLLADTKDVFCSSDCRLRDFLGFCIIISSIEKAVEKVHDAMWTQSTGRSMGPRVHIKCGSLAL